MKSFKYLFLLIIALTIAVASCSKKDEATKSKKELLTAHQWKLSSSKTNGVADVISDCEKDDITTFSSNGTYTWNITTVKCYASETNDTGTWTLSSDETIFTVDGTVVTIVELSGSKLVVST